jgi:transcriptional regulator with XRE-family HTH domain
VSFVYRNGLAAKLITNKKYRDAYVLEHVKNSIPSQIRALREQREWKQSDLGEKAGKQQHGIARLEDPRIGHKLSIKTLLELASAFDVALLVKFVPFSRLVKEYEDVSFEALSAASITDEKEIEKLNDWATEEEEEVEPIAARAKEDFSSALDVPRLFHSIAGLGDEVMPELREKMNLAQWAHDMGLLQSADFLKQEIIEQFAKNDKAPPATNVVSMLDRLAGRRKVEQQPAAPQNDLLALATGGRR